MMICNGGGLPEGHASLREAPAVPETGTQEGTDSAVTCSLSSRFDFWLLQKS